MKPHSSTFDMVLSNTSPPATGLKSPFLTKLSLQNFRAAADKHYTGTGKRTFRQEHRI